MENRSNQIDSIADIQDQMKRLSEVINAKCTKLALEEQKLEQEKSIFNSTHKILMSFNDPINTKCWRPNIHHKLNYINERR